MAAHGRTDKAEQKQQVLEHRWNIMPLNVWIRPADFCAPTGVPGTAVCQLASTRGDASATVWVGSTSVTLGGSRGQQAELNGFYYAANVCMGTATDAAGGSLP
jgi:hypothetical protein